MKVKRISLHKNNRLLYSPTVPGFRHAPIINLKYHHNSQAATTYTKIERNPQNLTHLAIQTTANPTRGLAKVVNESEKPQIGPLFGPTAATVTYVYLCQNFNFFQNFRLKTSSLTTSRCFTSFYPNCCFNNFHADVLKNHLMSIQIQESKGRTTKSLQPKPGFFSGNQIKGPLRQTHQGSFGHHSLVTY